MNKRWLEKRDACKEGVVWFENQKERNGIEVVEKLIKEKKLDWANWLIVRLMKYKQYISYVVYAAEQVIGIYEKKYPNDKRPRQAIEAAKKCIKSPTKKNKAAAYAAAAAAADAAYAADAADAAYAAADAAAYAADAAYAAYAAADDAYAADAAAAYAAAKQQMELKILEYGIKLLRGK